MKPVNSEGKQGGHWIALDYDFAMVHVFFDYVRDYYALEELWPKGKIIRAKAAAQAT